MATVAHCLFCFDVLAANLENRAHLSLQQVEDLWSRYQQEDQKRPPRNHDSDNPDYEQETEDADGTMSESDHDLEELSTDEDEPPAEESTKQPSTLRLPSISRLQAPSPASASSSSSTPSSFSASSSRLGLDDNSSKASSNTSFFSFGRRSHQPSPTQREEQYPLFVTWNTISARGHKSLRGCIGTFEPQDLATGLESYALTAYVTTPIETAFGPH